MQDVSIKEHALLGSYVDGLKTMQINSLDDLMVMYSTAVSVRDYRYCANSTPNISRTHTVIKFDI